MKNAELLLHYNLAIDAINCNNNIKTNPQAIGRNIS